MVLDAFRPAARHWVVAPACGPGLMLYAAPLGLCGRSGRTGPALSRQQHRPAHAGARGELRRELRRSRDSIGENAIAACRLPPLPAARIPHSVRGAGSREVGAGQEQQP